MAHTPSNILPGIQYENYGTLNFEVVYVKILFGLLCSFNEGWTIFTIPMLRFCCLGSGRLRCLWFLMGLSHPLHAQNSPTQCAAAQG